MADRYTHAGMADRYTHSGMAATAGSNTCRIHSIRFAWQLRQVSMAQAHVTRNASIRMAGHGGTLGCLGTPHGCSAPYLPEHASMCPPHALRSMPACVLPMPAGACQPWPVSMPALAGQHGRPPSRAAPDELPVSVLSLNDSLSSLPCFPS
jgi:hypothetical protein